MKFASSRACTRASAWSGARAVTASPRAGGTRSTRSTREPAAPATRPAAHGRVAPLRRRRHYHHHHQGRRGRRLQLTSRSHLHHRL
jgi:hypothetical protein